MTADIKIRDSLLGDVPSLESLYPTVFPDEDLLPVVRNLLREGDIVLSLVATGNGELVGHVMFSICRVAGFPDKVALLGPLAVAPASQRRGIGSALIQDGFQRLRIDGVTQVYVLGDPGYYRRHGFVSEDAVAPPYPLAEEWDGAWQSVELNETDQRYHGQLSVTPSWSHPELWQP